MLEREQSRDFPSTRKMIDLKRNLCQSYREEEVFWNQKSQQKWLKVGDKNTKFFHASVKANRGKKRVVNLIDVNGNLQRSEASKGAVAVAYFQDIFTSSNPDSFEEMFSGFVPRVSMEMNEELCKIVSKEEVRDAVFAIKSASAPGADGFTGFFFQKYWDIIGDQVTLEVQDFFLSGNFPGEWNYTQLFLLPKKENPEHMADLRPISLCSVLYKIIYLQDLN